MVEKTNIPGHHLLVRYLHDSHQGSCTLETDESGNVITYEEYHPFGTSSYQATNAGILSSSKRYRYVGKERDEESGLYYYGARFYAPWLCRFMSCDPKAAQFPDQSPYNYCFNNPINLIDPDGMEPEGMGDEVVNNTSNIGFPENPKDGDEYIHYNQEQNANWGYVYNAASQSWLGTGTAANLPTVEVTASATPRSVFTSGPLMGQNLREISSGYIGPMGNYYEGFFELSYSADLRSVTLGNYQNMSQLRYLGRPSDSQIMERAVQLSQDGMLGVEYKSFGLNTKGDASVKLKTSDTRTLNASVNIVDPSFKSGGINKVNLSTTSVSYGPASFVNKTEVVQDPPMRVIVNGVVTGTVQYSFQLETKGIGYGASIEKNTVRAVEGFTNTAGEINRRSVGEITTKSIGGSFTIMQGLKLKANIPMIIKTR
jgi:RHS repeat-associated protein